VILGEKLDTYDRINALVKKIGLTKKVVFTGYIDSKHMGPVLADAFCSIYPSLYEGFGFPPIESMSVGCPVITADNSSLPEVVGKAGLYFKATDVDGIVRQFTKLARDKKLRAKLVQMGYQNIKRFSWDKNYQQVLKIYNQLAK
jgi:glycosyltransferase involved in cell wall biosynthesis